MIINQIYGGGKTGASAHLYAVDIEINNSNPKARCTYPTTVGDLANGCAGFTPAENTQMNDWDGANIIGNIKPVQFDGTDIVDLDKRNLRLKADGTSSEIGTLGYDAMVYIPTWYLSITKDGAYIHVRFADEQLDSTYQDYAGSVTSNRKGRFMLGCYPAYSVSSNLYSRYGVTPSTSVTYSNNITYAQARGTGYDIMTFYQWTYLQALLVLVYKSTDLQTACARGHVDGSSVRSNGTYTYENDYGISGGTATGSGQMSFLWLNDLWGNVNQFIGGASVTKLASSTYRTLKTYNGYATVTTSLFSSTDVYSTQNINAPISKVSGTTESGFYPLDGGDDYDTYFADFAYLPGDSGTVYGKVGGDYNDGDDAGPFYTFFNYSSSDTAGTRLSYRL